MPLYKGITLPGQPSYSNIQRLDTLAIPTLMEMMRVGFAIDIPYLQDMTQLLTENMQEAKDKICSYIPEDKLEEFVARSNVDSVMNVDSNEQVEELLFKVLKIGRTKQLKRTKSGKRISTGKKQLEVLKREHPIVQDVLNYKEYAKLKSTYTQGLMDQAVLHNKGKCWCGANHLAETWRIHTIITTTRTDTGRLASKAPNLQNIPVRTELGRLIRQAFIATPGMVLVGCDWAQQEMRLGAHYSEDDNLLRIFWEGLDPHTDTAKRAFDVDEPDKLTQRDPSKNVNFGVFYGLGPPGLYDLMCVTYATAGIEVPDWMTVQWCEEFIKQWFKLYPGVKKYLEEQHYRAYRYGEVWTLFGRVRRVPEVRSTHKRVVEAGLRQAGNHPIQGTSADMMRLVLPQVQEWIESELRPQGVLVYPLLTVHDEGIWEVEEGYAEEFKQGVEGIFCNALTDRDSGESLCKVPIKADGKVMERWVK